MAILRVVLVVLLGVLGTGLLPSASLGASTANPAARRSTHMAAVDGRLQAQVRRALTRSHGFLRDNQAGPLIRLSLISSRDVAADIRALGGQVYADIGGKVLAAALPADRVWDLARKPGVVGMYAEDRAHPELDISVPEIRANQAWGLADTHGLPLRGTHVLVGIVDTGIDYHNPDFKNPDGSTRIKYIWDQTLRGTPPPGYPFGTECDSSSINSGQCPEKDSDGHGTHVAGIAAGNGLSGNPPKEIGVAPQADLIVVKTDFSTVGILTAWQYLVDRARQLREPIVINNSFGSQLGPHDGSEVEAQAIDLLSTQPGIIFVKSAGDSGAQGAHTDGTIGQDGVASIPFDATGYLSKSRPISVLSFALFYSSQDRLTFGLQDPGANETLGPLLADTHIDGQMGPDGDTRYTVIDGPFDPNLREVYVAIQSASGRQLTSHFVFQLQGQAVLDGGRYDAWMQQEGAGHFLHADPSDTLTIPADANKVIDVGDYATRVSWTDLNGQQHNVCDLLTCLNGTLAAGDIEADSGQGPTADGRQKPDISAPGLMIVSSLTHDKPVCSASTTTSCLLPAFVSQGGNNFVLGGSSMSAAHITGVVALMLQAEPTLNPDDVAAMLRSTARHDQFTGSAAWTPTFGAGKVDAYAAAQAALAAPHPAHAMGTPPPDLFQFPPTPVIKPTGTPAPPTATAAPTDPPTAVPTKTKEPPTPTPVPTATPKKGKTGSSKTRTKCKKGYKVVHGKCRKIKKKKTHH